MAFPASPSNNQIHKEGNRAFVYDSALGVWDQVREINRALVPSSGGGGVPLSASKLTTESLVFTPGTGGERDVSVEGTMYYNEDDNSLYVSNGVGWMKVNNNFSADGGTKTTHGIYTVHSFLSGTTTWTPTTAGTVDILVVAGGGGAGARFHSGGGGAGGVRVMAGQTVDPVDYTIIVGAGGAAGAPANHNVSGSKGSNSSFSGPGLTITATGGGGGAGYELSGGAGGSGGGGNGGESADSDTFGAGNEGGYSPVEGYAGAAVASGAGYHAGGGGGGAGAAGGNSGRIADGGDGIANYWRDGNTSGTTAGIHHFGGGGVGSSAYSATGHSGGVPIGTHGGGAMSVAGTANSGGGGGASSTSVGASGAGGSGIVVIRHITY